MRQPQFDSASPMIPTQEKSALSAQDKNVCHNMVNQLYLFEKVLEELGHRWKLIYKIMLNLLQPNIHHTLTTLHRTLHQLDENRFEHLMCMANEQHLFVSLRQSCVDTKLLEFF